MKDRKPRYPGRVLITPELGSAYYATLTAADDPEDEGTPLNKATFLTDEVAAALRLGIDDPTPNDAFRVMAQTQTYTVEVPVSWTADTANGNFYQSVAVTGVLSVDNPTVDIVLGSNATTNEDLKDAWSLIDRVVTYDGAVTLITGKEAPSIAFTMQIKVVR